MKASFHARAFRPAPWARGRHAQTLWARGLRAGADPGMARTRWETPDGDFLDVDVGPLPSDDAPIALLVHGLEGSARRRYVLGTCRELLAHGVRPVALNLRGCSGVPNRLPRFYHSGETGDLTFALERLRKAHPAVPIGVFGFSLGGNAMLKMLGEREDGGEALVDAAVAMSVPFDLAAGADGLERTRMGHFYAAYFLRSLRGKIRAKEAMLRPLIDVDRALSARTIRAFDDVVTAPLHGFADAAAYYSAASSRHFIPGIRVRTLVLHSLDDPFLPPEAVPREALEANAAVLPILTRRGGHVGFLEGSLRRPRLWGDEEGARFLAESLRTAPGFLDARESAP